jgi:hypothetical protein
MAGYSRLRFTRAAAAWRRQLARRVYPPPTRDFGWLERFELDNAG